MAILRYSACISLLWLSTWMKSDPYHQWEKRKKNKCNYYHRAVTTWLAGHRDSGPNIPSSCYFIIQWYHRTKRLPGSLSGLIFHDHALDDVAELAEVLTQRFCTQRQQSTPCSIINYRTWRTNERVGWCINQWNRTAIARTWSQFHECDR